MFEKKTWNASRFDASPMGLNPDSSVMADSQEHTHEWNDYDILKALWQH